MSTLAKRGNPRSRIGSKTRIAGKSNRPSAATANCLEADRRRLNELNGLAIDLDQTATALDVGDSDCRFLRASQAFCSEQHVSARSNHVDSLPYGRRFAQTQWGRWQPEQERRHMSENPKENQFWFARSHFATILQGSEANNVTPLTCLQLDAESEHASRNRPEPAKQSNRIARLKNA